jgi:hypothetical protein
VLQRFDSSEKSRFCSKTALPKCLTINDPAFLQNRESEGFFGKIEKLQHFRTKCLFVLVRLVVF